MTQLLKFIFNVIIGILLGDGHLTVSSTSKNASLGFALVANWFLYAWHIYELLSFLCLSLIRIDKPARKDKTTSLQTFCGAGLFLSLGRFADPKL